MPAFSPYQKMPSRWPVHYAGVADDAKHWWHNLDLAVPFFAGTGNEVQDVVSRRRFVFNGDGTGSNWAQHDKGIAFRSVSGEASEFLQDSGPQYVPSNSQTITIASVFFYRDTDAVDSARRHQAISEENGGGIALITGYANAPGQIRFILTLGGTRRDHVQVSPDDTSLAADDFYVIIGTRAEDNSIQIYQNGRSLSLNNVAGNAGDLPTSPFDLRLAGAWKIFDSQQESRDLYTYAVYVWGRHFTADDAQRLTIDPFGPFRPKRRFQAPQQVIITDPE